MIGQSLLSALKRQQRKYFALKGQQHLAQGNALGSLEQSMRPVRAKASEYVQNAFALTGRREHIAILYPGCRYALPWAMCRLPFQGVLKTPISKHGVFKTPISNQGVLKTPISNQGVLKTLIPKRTIIAELKHIS